MVSLTCFHKKPLHAPPYRITLIHPSAGINLSGGAEIMAIEMAHQLSQFFEVELISGGRCNVKGPRISSIDRCKAYRFVRSSRIGKLLQRWMKHPEIVIEHLTSAIPCLWYLLRHPPDVIYPHNDYGGLAVAKVAQWLTGARIIYTEHNGMIASGQCLKRNLYFQPDHLVVFDQRTADFVKQVRAVQPVDVIHNGVDLDRFTPQGDRIDFHLPGPVILCVASLNRNNHKRVELTLEALARLPEVSLLICGDGPDRDYYQALGMKMLGSDRFRISSFTHDEMPMVYRSADLFTLASVNEPFALSYLEALASGLPIVTTQDEVRQYIVGEGGKVCDVTNPEIYAQTLKDILSNPTWRLLARKTAQRFNWSVIAKAYRDVILETLGASQG
jgi:glycosyltransferase involved in cell wall biosynthesis